MAENPENKLITVNPCWEEGKREKQEYWSAAVSCQWRKGEGAGKESGGDVDQARDLLPQEPTAWNFAITH